MSSWAPRVVERAPSVRSLPPIWLWKCRWLLMRQTARRPCSTGSRQIRWRGRTRVARWQTWWRGTPATGSALIGMPLTHHVMCNTGIGRRKHFPIHILHESLRDRPLFRHIETHSKESHVVIMSWQVSWAPCTPCLQTRTSLRLETGIIAARRCAGFDSKSTLLFTLFEEAADTAFS